MKSTLTILVFLFILTRFRFIYIAIQLVRSCTRTDAIFRSFLNQTLQPCLFSGEKKINRVLQKMEKFYLSTMRIFFTRLSHAGSNNAFEPPNFYPSFLRRFAPFGFTLNREKLCEDCWGSKRRTARHSFVRHSGIRKLLSTIFDGY